MGTYFLSYSRSDTEIALRFANDLIAAGVPVWVDQYDIRPSEHWDRAVEAAVRDCEGLIVLLSPRSAESPNVADEVSVALHRKKWIVPILVEKCDVPLRMTRMQFIDATNDYARALERCLAEIGRKAATNGGVDAGPMPPAPPAARLPVAVTDAAIRRLTPLVGPIATVLVRTAAAQATSEAALYSALAAKLSNAAQREAFLKSAAGSNRAVAGLEPSATQGSSATDAATSGIAVDIDRAVTLLTRHLGPIAGHLVRREQQAAGSSADLHARLANLLPTERARADFIKQIETM